MNVNTYFNNSILAENSSSSISKLTESRICSITHKQKQKILNSMTNMITKEQENNDISIKLHEFFDVYFIYINDKNDQNLNKLKDKITENKIILEKYDLTLDKLIEFSKHRKNYFNHGYTNTQKELLKFLENQRYNYKNKKEKQETLNLIHQGIETAKEHQKSFMPRKKSSTNDYVLLKELLESAISFSRIRDSFGTEDYMNKRLELVKKYNESTRRSALLRLRIEDITLEQLMSLGIQRTIWAPSNETNDTNSIIKIKMLIETLDVLIKQNPIRYRMIKLPIQGSNKYSIHFVNI